MGKIFKYQADLRVRQESLSHRVKVWEVLQRLILVTKPVNVTIDKVLNKWFKFHLFSSFYRYSRLWTMRFHKLKLAVDSCISVTLNYEYNLRIANTNQLRPYTYERRCIRSYVCNRAHKGKLHAFTDRRKYTHGRVVLLWNSSPLENFSCIIYRIPLLLR